MIDAILNIIYNLVGAALTFLATVFWKRIRHWRIRKIIPTISHRALVNVAGYKLGTSPNADFYVHAEAIFAASKLAELFARFGITINPVIDKLARTDEFYNLEICIGGNMANVCTKSYLETYCRANYLDRQQVKSGQSVIIKLRLKSSPEGIMKTIIILFGENANDTQACVNYFSQQFDSLIRPFSRYDKVLLRLDTLDNLGAKVTAIEPFD
jgi:hypothetical protein